MESIVKAHRGTARLLLGDVRDVLKTLPSESVQTCVTSPPYFGLRDYDMPGQIGLEQSPVEYVEQMVGVFREIRRVLRKDGTAWLNLGDSYAGSGKGRMASGEHSPEYGSKQGTSAGTLSGCLNKTVTTDSLKPKDLIGIPWRVAFALQEDGWYLRSDIIWSKPNPMPESVRDRPTKAHEYVFLLAKSQRYYYDVDAIREPHLTADRQGERKSYPPGIASSYSGQAGEHVSMMGPQVGLPLNEVGRNKRSVWTVTPQNYKEAHFATFPEALVEPCILAGSKESDTVLDPFMGSGTTLRVALLHGRDAIGIELNAEYIELAKKRIAEPVKTRKASTRRGKKQPPEQLSIF